MKRGFPPSIFIIGAQKCGTTSLASLLASHPDICISQPKEPNFFSTNYHRGINWYRERFSDTDRILLDASTTYSMCPLSSASLEYKPGRSELTCVPERIYAENGGARIIYLIRDPVMRAYSNYWHNVKYGYESIGFEEAFNVDLLYREVSMYWGQLQKFIEYFDKKNILVIKFESFVENQIEVLRLCEDFLSLEPNAYSLEKVHKNKGGVYSPLGAFLVGTPMVKRIALTMPDKYRKLIKKSVAREIPEIDKEIYERLKRVFKEDQALLEEEMCISYSEFI